MATEDVLARADSASKYFVETTGFHRESWRGTFQSNLPAQKCTHCLAASFPLVVAESNEPHRVLGTNVTRTTVPTTAKAPTTKVVFNAGFILSVMVTNGC